jgi:hypothetical protein
MQTLGPRSWGGQDIADNFTLWGGGKGLILRKPKTRKTDGLVLVESGRIL